MEEVLSLDDARSIIRLLGEVAGMNSDLAVKRRFLLEGLAKLIGAHDRAWSHVSIDDSGMPVIFWIIEGGWSSESQRELVMSSNFHPDSQEVNQKVLGFAPSRFWTRSCGQIFSSDEWYSSSFYSKFRRDADLDDFIYTSYPLPTKSRSIMSFHRALGKPRFSDRDRCIVHLVVGEIDWLHRMGTENPAPSNVLELTLRQREVLLLLLAGHSGKQIAHQLHLSEHTIGDHLKSLHKHFNVSSRGELLAKFISGGGPF